MNLFRVLKGLGIFIWGELDYANIVIRIWMLAWEYMRAGKRKIKRASVDLNSKAGRNAENWFISFSSISTEFDPV